MQTVKTNSNNSGVNFLTQMILFSFGPIIGAVFAFCASIIAALLISPEELGKVSLFVTAITLLGLLGNLGLDRAYMREFSSAKDKEELLFNCLSLSLLNSLFVGFLIVLFRSQISYFIFDKYDLVSISILAMIVPVDIIGEYSLFTCRLYGDVKKYTFISIIQQISYLFFILIFYYAGVRGYITIIYARALSIFAKSIIAVFCERVHFKLFRKFDKKIVISSLQYGIPYMPALICSWILHSMDKYALRVWSTFSEIGYYSSAFTIVSILAIVRSAFSSFWTPLAYKWYDKGEDVRKFEKVGEYITVILCVLSSFIVLFRNVIYKVYKPEYYCAANIIPFLLYVISMETMSYVVGCGINLKKKTVYNLLATASACVVNFLGNAILVPYFGGVGASISTGLSSIIYMLIKMLISRSLWYKFNVSRYIVNVLLITAMSSCALIFNLFYFDLFFSLIIILYNYKSIFCIYNIAIDFFNNSLKVLNKNKSNNY